MLVKIKDDLYLSAIDVVAINVYGSNNVYRREISTRTSSYTAKFNTKEEAVASMDRIAELVNKALEEINKQEQGKLRSTVRQLMMTSKERGKQ